MPDSRQKNNAPRSDLRRCDLDPDPLNQFRFWFEEARVHEPNLPEAMVLGTMGSGGYPQSRVVLLKGYDERGFEFYTNYESRKAVELGITPVASLLFHWKKLQRQVRIQGPAEKISVEETDQYFQTRPRGSQLSAWASHQSRALNNRDELEAALRRHEHRYHGQPVPTPPFWGGYRVGIETMEFWQGRPNRLHDRFFYRRDVRQEWVVERLAP